MQKLVIKIIIIAAIFVICVLTNAKLAGGSEGNKKAFQREEVRTFTIIGAAAIAIIVLFSEVLMLNKIPSGSMETTIMTGDLVVSTRYDADEIERYDIVVFYFPDNPEEIYIKRVIGLPGETITVENGNVYADGVLLDDSFVNGEMDSSDDGIYEVPEGFYFMLGDNRNNSYDSRFWENPYVQLDDIIAKAKVVIYPFSQFGVLE